MASATTTPGSAAWRAEQAATLLDFGTASRVPRGFGYLDDSGVVDPSRPLELYLTSRMTHVYSLAALIDPSDERAAGLAAHGVRSLQETFHDDTYGGWFAAVDPAGEVVDPTKAAYAHAFVMLAASSAAALGVDGAADLLADVERVVTEHFWQEDEGRSAESFSADWSQAEGYRGANSNMHSVEAYTACADVSGHPVWRARALRIAEHVVGESTAENGWRMPEHFDTAWTPVLEYNADRKADPFRPYGSTPGHWMEWARLLVGLDAGSAEPKPWLLDAARRLFEAAAEVGWATDGSPGFVYTLGWQDEVVVDTRMHWVACEAVLAADALARGSGDDAFAEAAGPWWQFIADRFVDPVAGSWWHEVGPDGQPTAVVWQGKPDLYHAYHACVLPDLPLAPAAAAAAAAPSPGPSGPRDPRNPGSPR